jgi:nitrate reductase (NAD(P)H)
VKVEVWRFLHARSIMIRAVDSSFNMQPHTVPWNVLGMMNNSWYTVKIQVESNPHQAPSLIFRHPVLPGSNPGGWKERESAGKRPVEMRSLHTHTLPTATGAQLFFGKVFTLAEVEKHTSIDDCWIIVDNDVYDVTPYMKDHPGGSVPILLYAGKDATQAFKDIHAHDAYVHLHWYKIGE